ncbi:phosphodiester glycosidase family protein, partial [Brunnivagina elsteri]|uniref:phosphodiester glycosidase family protein n=1 Tax=Brunnivagina elsteri TaxID=1247191 RepID=UPI0011775970
MDIKPQKYLGKSRRKNVDDSIIKASQKWLFLIISSLLSLTTDSYVINAQTPTPVKPSITVPNNRGTMPMGKALPEGKTQAPRAILRRSGLSTIANGNQISLNGRIVTGAWFQRQTGKNKITTHIGDGYLKQLIGIDLLDTNIPTKQPIQWFSSPTKPQILTAQLAGSFRYLDITNLAKTSGWQIQTQGNVLNLTSPSTRITAISEASYTAATQVLIGNSKPSLPAQVSNQTAAAKRVTIKLDRPTPWQIRQELPAKRVVDPDAVNPQPTAPPNREWTIILDGIADPALVQRYTPITPAPTPVTPSTFPVIPPLPNFGKQLSVPEPIPRPIPITPPEATVKQVEVVNNQTLIRVSVPFGFAPRIQSEPNSLIVEIRPDALIPRNIAWANGLRWRQQWMQLGQEKFPVVWLEANPRNVQLRPIVTNADTLIGTAPWIQTAPKYLAVAGINGGYFNRNNKYPLGAIRSNGKWLSSPILNRGAIAWNNSGQFYVGRLSLEDNLVTTGPQGTVKTPILFLNSGYVQSGIARYTPAWGNIYTPLTDNETIIVVQKNQVTSQVKAGKAGENPVVIPLDGYLLTLRGKISTATDLFPTGTNLKIESATVPAEFNRYPNIIGAGPLLVQNRQIVLDAKAEKFSDAFIREKAIRSAICTTANGTVIIASTHNRAGGAGPTLAEHAQLMQKMGCVNALNLDGGSSTSLYLGGQLIDRSPSTAARVHNGIVIFPFPHTRIIILEANNIV